MLAAKFVLNRAQQLVKGRDEQADGEGPVFHGMSGLASSATQRYYRT